MHSGIESACSQNVCVLSRLLVCACFLQVFCDEQVDAITQTLRELNPSANEATPDLPCVGSVCACIC